MKNYAPIVARHDYFEPVYTPITKKTNSLSISLFIKNRVNTIIYGCIKRHTGCPMHVFDRLNAQGNDKSDLIRQAPKSLSTHEAKPLPHPANLADINQQSSKDGLSLSTTLNMTLTECESSALYAYDGMRMMETADTVWALDPAMVKPWLESEA